MIQAYWTSLLYKEKAVKQCIRRTQSHIPAGSHVVNDDLVSISFGVITNLSGS